MNFHTRPEWQNIEVQSINRLAAHSPYGNSYSLSLDGTWRFKLCEHPSLLPAGFYLPDFNELLRSFPGSQVTVLTKFNAYFLDWRPMLTKAHVYQPLEME